jgi:hypothetical protein
MLGILASETMAPEAGSSTGEPPFANQPQPVYPEESPGDT